MNNICVVLVEPLGPLNVGSVCRVMMNFGISDLRLVNPSVNYDGFEARQMALKAVNVLENVKIFTDLSQAIKDCGFILGTTCRVGKYRRRDIFLSPEQAAKKTLILSDANQVAYVFGREDNGLSNEDLKICNFYITIPTEKSYKSVNLSHAVSLCLYEVQKQYQKKLFKNDESKISLACGKEIESMLHHMKKTLLNIGYLNCDNPDHIIRTLRRVFNRAGLDSREVRAFHGLWSRIDWIKKELDKSAIQE